MSQDQFNEIMEAFKTKFPPAQNAAKSSLKLTTKEIEEMILDFHPEISFPEGGLFPALKEMGYQYGPIEENERVTMYWFVTTVGN